MNNSIYDIAACNGKLYISDYKNNKIIIYDLLEKTITGIFGVDIPHGIAVDNNDNSHICTHKDNSVVIIKKQEDKKIN